jgi:2-methylcitrate dehydratase PrpD
LSNGLGRPEEGEGPTTALARFASGLRLVDIPAEARERVKWLVLDSIGCMVAGLGGEEIPQVTVLADAIGPTGESSVVGGGTMSLGAATFLNAYLLSASTAMDSFVPAAFHLTPETVPPALAVAEQQHRSGRDLIEAIAAGLEIGVRIAKGLNLASFRGNGWHAPGVVGPFAGAIAGGRLLGCDAAQLRDAIGLAGSQSAGTYACWGTPTVKFHQARGALSGLMAAVLANQGFASAPEFLTATDGGLYSSYCDGGDPSAVLRGLGDDFALEEISFRRWPGAHSGVATALFGLLDQGSFDIDDIERISVFVPPSTARSFGVFDGASTRFEALNSIHHVVAVVMRYATLGPEHFSRFYYEDQQLRQFAIRRVHIEGDASLGREGARVRVERRGGASQSFTSEHAKGSPSNPLTLEELLSKFRSLCEGWIADAAIDSIIDMVLNLEDEADCSRLVGLTDL